MDKWADFGISAVRYDSEHERIVALLCHADERPGFPPGVERPREVVVSEIEAGRKGITLTRFDGRWQYGAEVNVFRVNGTAFIRTDGNSIEADNLGELPEF